MKRRMARMAAVMGAVGARAIAMTKAFAAVMGPKCAVMGVPAAPLGAAVCTMGRAAA